MASVTRTLFRAAAPAARIAARRSYSTAAPAKSRGGLFLGLTTVAAGAGGGYYLYSTGQLDAYLPASVPVAPKVFVPTAADYQNIYNDVADILEDNDYDDGSFGPVRSP